jgi:1-acyl-sn-glycerol-3-phosphate acyltransferase
MPILRAILFYMILLPFALIFGSLCVFTFPVPYRQRYNVIMSFNRIALWALRVCCGVKYQIKGGNDLPDAAFVVISKHQSTWETFFLQLHFAPMSTVLKRELLRIPGFGWGLALLKPIAIDRSNPRAALKKVKADGTLRLSEGNNVLIFPEGTRTQPGSSGTYARSGADIAINANAPIVAVAHNAGLYWPKDGIAKHAGTIEVSISSPMYAEGRNSKQLTADVKEWIESEVSLMAQSH